MFQVSSDCFYQIFLEPQAVDSEDKLRERFNNLAGRPAASSNSATRNEVCFVFVVLFCESSSVKHL